MLSGKRGVLIFLATLTCHEAVPRNPGWNGAAGKKGKGKKEESWVTTRRENFLRGNLFRITTHG